jgi:hypothetical protein
MTLTQVVLLVMALVIVYWAVKVFGGRIGR